MNLKICLFIVLFAAIACTTSVDARKSSRRRKAHHSSSHKHISSSHHEEGTPNKVESDHSTPKHHHPDLETKTTASSHVDGGQNNQNVALPGNTQHQNKHSSESDFADGFSAGLAAARRQRRRRTTTSVPSTTTVTATTTLKSCLSDAPTPNNNLQPNTSNSVVQCEVLSTPFCAPLQSFNFK